MLSTVGSKVRIGGHLWCALARWPSMAPLVSVVAAGACARGVISSIVVAIVLDVIIAVPP